MTVETAADRAAFLADFGRPVSWQVGSAEPIVLMALFDSGTLQQGLQDTVATLATRATLTLRAEDLPAGAGDPLDIIVVNTVVFHPKTPMPDGQGMVVVTLEAEC